MINVDNILLLLHPACEETDFDVLKKKKKKKTANVRLGGLHNMSTNDKGKLSDDRDLPIATPCATDVDIFTVPHITLLLR